MANCSNKDDPSTSSSEDDLMISSPDISDDDDEDSVEDGGMSPSKKKLRKSSHHDDVFKFHAQKFSKVVTSSTNNNNQDDDDAAITTTTVNKAVSSSSSSSHHPPSLPISRRGRPRKAQPLGIEEKLSILEQRQRARRTSSGPVQQPLDSDDDTDDTDDSVVVETTTTATTSRGGTTSKSTNGRKLELDSHVASAVAMMPSSSSGGMVTRTTRASMTVGSQISVTGPVGEGSAAVVAVEKASVPEVYELSSSDDDDDDEDCVAMSNLSSLPADVAEIVKRSRLAKTKLAAAQQYHADDIIVEVEEPVIPTTSSSSLLLSSRLPISVPNPPPVSPASLGHKMKFVCRVHLHGAGGGTTKRGPHQEVTVGVRHMEKLSVVVERIGKALQLPSTTKMVMKFDGNVLDQKKTPKDYEMEDEDMIDVSVP